MDYHSLVKHYPNLFENTNALIRIVTDEDEIKAWREDRLKKSTEEGQPAQWIEIGDVFEDPYIVILRDLVEFPDGYKNVYIRLYNRAYLEAGAQRVVILPELHGKFLLEYQFRHATRSWHWEIPRGFSEPGVQAEDQARAEVEEEIGGEIAEMTSLGLYFNNTGLEGNPIFLFLAEMKSVGEPTLGFGVDQFIWVSISELEKMIANGEITDGFTIAAYTRAKLKGLI